MDSRPLLENANNILVFIDSVSFDRLLSQHDELAFAILDHYDSPYIDFIRSPSATEHNELRNIPEYELEIKDSQIVSIKLSRKDTRVIQFFRYKMDDIRSIAKRIFGEDEVKKDELDRITSVFIQAHFAGFERSNIYVSADETLLKSRLWFESHFPGCPLNIMSIEEASVFLDLFFKKLGKYFIRSRYSTYKGDWYWMSMRLRIPHYNVGDIQLDALANRMYYALMALDEIGIQHYLGVNNDTMDATLYHFNYMITLITGIFDNLALKTDSYLDINFKPVARVSLSSSSGSDFLKEIRERNPDIRHLISSYVDFIDVIYLLRELILHREGLTKTGFIYRDPDVRWTANFVRISDRADYHIRRCGDLESSLDPYSVWGVHRMGSELFLDPYSFSARAIETLVRFVDEYLKVLGYPSFIEAQKKLNDDFARRLALFEKYRLGHR
jgi:hypothetical protein